MPAFWLVGFEERSPDDSGEICVVELYGRSVGAGGSDATLGVKAHRDPRLVDDVRTVPLDLDATPWHTYAAEWAPDPPEIRFLVDDRLVGTVRQRIDYPLQLMVDLFEFPGTGPRDPADYPKTGGVRSVRAFRRP